MMNKKTTITVVPIGGLCNRINTIKCAIATHNKLGYNFDVYWRNCSELKADFEQLFEPVDLDGVRILPMKNPLLWNGGNHLGGAMTFFRKFMGYDKTINGSLHSNEDFEKVIEDSKRAYIYASNRFSPYGDADASSFLHPVKKLQERIVNICKDFDNVVGIHIRRTDNVAAIKTSTDDKFFDRMDKMLETNPEVRFFLATDCNDVKDLYEQRYGSKIITNHFDLSRNTLAGMENAVVDLWCLALCTEILGSASSTYSTCAAGIYHHKIGIIS